MTCNPKQESHLGIDVFRKVIGQQVVITASRNGGDHGLKKVVPAKLALPDQVSHPSVPRIQLQRK